MQRTEFAKRREDSTAARNNRTASSPRETAAPWRGNGRAAVGWLMVAAAAGWLSAAVPLSAQVDRSLPAGSEATPAGAFTATNPPERAPATDISVEPLTRLDYLRWSIAGSNGSPNILSELTWSALWSVGGALSATIPQGDAGAVTGMLRAGRIVIGHNQDSDYNGNNRTDEFLRSVNTANAGAVVSGNLGLSVALDRTFRAGFGAFVDVQLLRITDGTQYIFSASGSTSSVPIPGLNATYDATWLGPWIGIETGASLGPRIEFRASVDGRLAAYFARANWINIANFAHPVSFTHAAIGAGGTIAAGLRVEIGGRLSATIGANGEAMVTVPGTDTLYLASGGTVESRLNQVLSLGGGLRLGLAIDL